MKVALVWTPFCSIQGPPVALASLASSLRQSNYEVFCFDLNIILYHSSSEEDKAKWSSCYRPLWHMERWVIEFISRRRKLVGFFINQILEKEVSAVGFSIYSTTLFASLEIAHRLKEKAPKLKIIFGGPEFNNIGETIHLLKEINLVNAVVINEGEITLPQLLSIIEEKGDVDYCCGTIIKKNGRVIDCGRREPIEDLDRLPFLDYSDFLPLHYKTQVIIPSQYVFLEEAVGLVSSRGCINSCTFCVEWLQGARYRSMSGRRIFLEVLHQLKVLGKNPKRFFYFADSSPDIKALSEFSDLVIENNLNILWGCQIAISPNLSKNLLEKMKRAGCVTLLYGIESGSQRVLNKMKKPFKIQEAERILRETSQAGIFIKCTFIIGFPTETRNDFKNTLNFIVRNRKYIGIVNPNVCLLTKGSKIFENYKQFGILSNQEITYWETKNHQNNFPERLKRYEDFYQCAKNLNIPCGDTIFLFHSIYRCYSEYTLKELYLAFYYLSKNNHRKAVTYFLNSLEKASAVRYIAPVILGYITYKNYLRS